MAAHLKSTNCFFMRRKNNVGWTAETRWHICMHLSDSAPASAASHQSMAQHLSAKVVAVSDFTLTTHLVMSLHSSTDLCSGCSTSSYTSGHLSAASHLPAGRRSWCFSTKHCSQSIFKHECLAFNVTTDDEMFLNCRDVDVSEETVYWDQILLQTLRSAGDEEFWFDAQLCVWVCRWNVSTG